MCNQIERNNLAIRTFMRRFTRLALGFSKRFEIPAAAVALHMAAGVTSRLGSFDDLMAVGR